MQLLVFTDGGARGNPGPGAIGVVVKDDKGYKIKEIGKRIGETTNNVAEYTAVREALKWIKSNFPIFQFSNETKKNFFLDSNLVVNQLNGLFKVKEAKLRELLVKIRELEQEVGGNVSYTFIPREKNWEADRLVNRALDS
ncbi:ribonuclease HI family protein [Candidatus Gottesmanbacteria bacterium]|nr:ribonuclease HI family protein [Candidatus Gottesmanbacteria bacterium]